MSDKDYCYPPEFNVLKNKLNIRNADDLEKIERIYVLQRTRQGVPKGNFDLSHLQAIHKHLFQDVYEWAGEIRTVRLTKENQEFQYPKYIAAGMQDVHGRIKKAGYLQGLNKSDFAHKAGEIIGDVNFVHPFREGNGRTQLQYLKQLGERAGHKLDLGKLEKDKWLEASRQAHGGKDYDLMASSIESAIIDREKTSDSRSEELKKRYEGQRASKSQRENEKDRER
ncbi:MAG: cell division protein [Deltaproteobacteria bacterium]|nr:cell division protein [Deltaproteobacteria bacterium]